MGWTLRGVGFTRNGSATNTDADGNNVAWVCDAPGCAVVLLAQLGAHVDEDDRIARACDYLLDHAMAPGGQFSGNDGRW